MTHQSASFDPSGGCKSGPTGGCKSGAVRHQRKTAQAKALRHIDQYDFCLIAQRIRNEGLVPAAMVEAAVDEFRKFCKLVVKGYDTLPMLSPWVDEVWHAAILHTERYMEFCRHAFGAYLHHVPHNELTPVDAGAPDRFFQVYAQEFGPLHPLWQVGNRQPASALCRVGPIGGCKSVLM